VPLLQAPFPVSGGKAWRVVLDLAAVEPKEVDVVTLHHQFHLGLLLCLLHCDEHNTAAMHMLLTFLVIHPVPFG
jgi:hypothetical protein